MVLAHGTAQYDTWFVRYDKASPVSTNLAVVTDLIWLPVSSLVKPVVLGEPQAVATQNISPRTQIVVQGPSVTAGCRDDPVY